jgi:outer membrane receptor protein involved in Fe transport
MTSSPPRVNRFRASLFLAIAALLTAGLPAALGQAVAPKTPPTVTTKEVDTDERITLNPFEISADATDTYEATNTNSVTGTNTPLNKTPLDAKVFNRQMMDEMGVVDMTEMLVKFGGLGPALIGAGNENVTGLLDGDRQDPKSMTMRGLQINNPRRDGFLRSDTTLLDSFDIERVEAIGGSNSLLFGSGDAGGVVTSTSKRAYLNRNRASVSASADSEGSWRYTFDGSVGRKMFAVRANLMKSEERYFRPGLYRLAEGKHVAATFQPWKWLQFRGEYRDYTRDTAFGQTVTVRAPTNLLLPNGSRVDNQNSRYLVQFPEIAQLLGGRLDLVNADSFIAPMHRDAYRAELKSFVMEAAPLTDLAIQVRWGEDWRVNEAPRATSTAVYAPDAVGNLYMNPTTGLIGKDWAMNQSMNAQPFWTGAKGYRASVAYQKDFGRWGRHQSSVFRQDMDSWTWQEPYRFYETDSSGNIIQNPALITNAESGRTAMPAVWMPIFPTSLIGGAEWPAYTINHPNGKTYKWAPQVYPGAVPPTPGNPLGMSGPISATTGQSTNTTWYHDDTNEASWGASLFSSFWKDRIDTMIGYRSEEASTVRVNTGLARGPITYDSLNLGTVLDTPVHGLRVSANYATNGKINFDTSRDIFNNPLPPGKGVSEDIGLKYDLWGGRLSGNFNYYISEAQNFTAGVPNRDDIDPDGINGRNGGGSYTYSKTSDGYNISLTGRPLPGWEVRFNFATANGSERTDVILPQFYNDQFNTMSLNGQTVVAVKNGTALAPLMVPSDPLDPASTPIALSLAMMKDANNPYFAVLDPEGGKILNAEALGLRTPGVGTDVTGLPLSDHQLGFVSPSGGQIVVRKAGERTIGYAEQSYSLTNRYQFREGRLRGLVVGVNTSLRVKYRAYMYTDAADGNQRKTFYYPDNLINDVFLRYPINLGRRFRAGLQVNVTNALDRNEVLYLKQSSNGTIRYAQWMNSPRKLSISTSVSY